MSRTPSTRGIAVVAGLAAVLLAVAASATLWPTVILEHVPELRALLLSTEPETVVLILLCVLVLLAPTLGVIGRLRSSPTAPLVDSTDASRLDDSVGDWTPPVVGASFDDDLDQATAYDDRSAKSREVARSRLVDSLRSIATIAYANRAGLSEDDAAAAVDDGTWTDDPRAAALLAGPDGPSIPLWLWFVDLVSSADPFVRSVERTITEIDRIQSTPTIETRQSGTEASS